MQQEVNFRQLRRHPFFRKVTPWLGLCRPPSGAPLWFPTHSVSSSGHRFSGDCGEEGRGETGLPRLLNLSLSPCYTNQLCEGHPDSAIKEELAGESTGQGCFIFCQAVVQVASVGECPSHWEGSSLAGQGTRHRGPRHFSISKQCSGPRRCLLEDLKLKVFWH